MPHKHASSFARLLQDPLALAVPLSLAACMALSGCSVGPLAKSTTAFATATTLLVAHSANAYRIAVDLHDDAQGYQAVAHFDPKMGYDPTVDDPLISAEGLEARMTVLRAIKAYAQKLADITNNVHSAALDDAAADAGKQVSGMSGTLATKLASSTSAGSTSTLLTKVDPGAVGIAAKALGLFLVTRKIKREIPKTIEEMQPNIKTLCALLSSDVAILRDQSSYDFDTMIEDQNSFILHNPSLGPLERRDEILMLPKLVRSERSVDLLLEELQESITKYDLAYQALAAAAHHKDPDSLRARLADLEASGEMLTTVSKTAAPATYATK